MHWIWLILAIALEVVGTTMMKLSEGFTRLFPSVLMGLFYAGSLACVTLALKKFDVSVAYTIWSGMGTIFIAMIGFFFFREPATLLKIVSIGLVVLGVVGLNLSGSAH